MIVCLDIIERSNNIANLILTDLDPLIERLNQLEQSVRQLATTIYHNATEQAILPVLKARLEVSELALALAQQAALHTRVRVVILGSMPHFDVNQKYFCGDCDTVHFDICVVRSPH